MLHVLLLGAAGGLGAASRFALDDVITRWRGRRGTPGPTPWATIGINVTGSLLLGLLTGLAASRVIGPGASAVLGTGFCGGYTTFSTASVETFRLLERRATRVAVLAALGTAAAALAAAGLGWWLGGRL